MCTKVRSSLTADYISHLKTIHARKKEIGDPDVSPLGKSRLNCDYRLTTDKRSQQKSARASCKNQLVMWGLAIQRSCISFLITCKRRTTHPFYH